MNDRLLLAVSMVLVGFSAVSLASSVTFPMANLTERRVSAAELMSDDSHQQVTHSTTDNLSLVAWGSYPQPRRRTSR